MTEILTQFGAGYAGENFSVEREKSNLLSNKKIDQKYSVLLSDNGKRPFSKKDKIINISHCYREPMAKELYDWLIETGLKDLGIKKDPKKPLIYVYIVHKG